MMYSYDSCSDILNNVATYLGEMKIEHEIKADKAKLIYEKIIEVDESNKGEAHLTNGIRVEVKIFKDTEEDEDARVIYWNLLEGDAAMF